MLLAIVPGLHAFNFPTGQQTVNDSGTLLVTEPIIEIKAITARKSCYRHNITTTTPAERRAQEGTNKYARKFKKLDYQYVGRLLERVAWE